jgi:hypothetical protein
VFPTTRATGRRPWPTVVVAVTALILYELYEWRAAHPRAPLYGAVERLAVARQSADAYGRAGDLVLTDANGVSVTVAAAPNIAGHRPLLGAIVDVATTPGDVTDPLLWFRTTTLDENGKTKDAQERTPQPFTCDDGGAGVRAYGKVGAGLTAEICAGDEGRFRLDTRLESLKSGAFIVDELNVGSRPVVVDADGAAWEEEHDTRFVATAHGGVALLIQAPKIHVSRTFSRFGAEVFPSAVILSYGGGTHVARTLDVVRGDVLDAVARVPSATRTVDVMFGADHGGELSLRDAANRELATAHVNRGENRRLRLPPNFGDYLILRDDRGIVTDAHVALPASGGSIRASTAPSGRVALTYTEHFGAPLPVHVLVKGIEGTADPLPMDATGRVVQAGRSLYLLDGHTDVTLAAGRYRLTASHGLTYSLAVSEITVDAAAPVNVTENLRAVIDTEDWVSADFHLHSAPSPDSDVSLEERVQSLACEGVDLAVATDHNRVTDLSPHVHSLGLDATLATAAGVEITSAGQRYGHFNAYPLPLPKSSPEEGVPAYFDKMPVDMFAAAREFGARVVQVNHARMDPGIGYFDLVHLDQRTGRASGEFSSDFDVFEAYNGMWIERRDKIREGPMDLVALARRGKRVATVGDSDSHKLFYEEAGYPRTFVHTPRNPITTRFERVVGGLLGAADTTVSSGPFVEMTVDGKPIGSVIVPKEGHVHVSIRVSAPAWVPVEHVEVWLNDAVARRFDVDGPPKDGQRFATEFDLPIDHEDAVLLAWADADAPLPDVVPYAHPLAVGFTGLLYVDANQDGKVVVPPRGP